jgi:hypothetical protein
MTAPNPEHPTGDSLETCPCAECASARAGMQWYYDAMRKQAEQCEAEYLADREASGQCFPDLPPEAA